MSRLSGLSDSLKFYRVIAGVLKELVSTQLKKKTLIRTLRQTIGNRALTVADPILLGDLQEQKAVENGDRVYLKYKDREYTYKEMDENSNRVANGLLSCGIKPREGVAIMMRNCPQFLDTVYATQKTGMYAVPVNTSLKGDGLVHIVSNSEARAIVVDHLSWERFNDVRDRLPLMETIIFERSEAPDDFNPGAEHIDLASFYGPDAPTARPAERPTRGDIGILMYTSGTTGLPKGVVWNYGDQRIELIGLLGKIAFSRDDNLYTCAPLFHANALFISGLMAMHANARFSLSQHFSARRIMDELRYFGATSFNALGSLMEIVMMQQPSPKDRDNEIRLVIAAAITADTWKRFEERYDVTVWNAYGAVDTGSGFIVNFGTSPKGSLGRPVGVKCRVIREDGEIAEPGEQGELQMYLGTEQPVEYFKDDEASEAKVEEGWVKTGDIVSRDDKGNYYYVGRDIERIRKRGENITCFEVEKEVMKHPAVEECAVYGVPSQLGEDDVMAAVILEEGKSVSPPELIDFLEDKLAKFQVPRYIRFMDALPKTEIFKVKKKELQDEGVTSETWDREKTE